MQSLALFFMRLLIFFTTAVLFWSTVSASPVSEADNACSGCAASAGPFDARQLLDIEVTSSIAIRGQFNDYSESDKVKKLIAAARKHIKNNPNRYIKRSRSGNTMTYCYRAVKEALVKAGILSSMFYGSSSASDGGDELKQFGFINLLEDRKVKALLKNNPRMAPKGAILVYETSIGAGVSRYGHIEIKTEHAGADGYISIKEKNIPTFGYAIPAQRKLVGVMVKT